MAKAERTFPNPRTEVPPRACGQCEHDLTAKALNEPCPECGWRPSVRCVTCGYDLAGIDEGGPCPECATPIAESIRGDGLAFASAEYLRSLSRGLALVRWGVGLLVLLWVAVVIVLYIFFSVLPAWVGSLLARSVLVIPAIVYAAGWWLATTPDPRVPPESASRSATCARWAAVGLVAALLLRAAVGSVQPMLVVPLSMIAFAFLVVQIATGGLWLRLLSSRVPNTKASKHAMLAIEAIAVLAIGLIALQMLQYPGVLPPRGSSGSMPGIIVVFLRLSMFVATIVTIARLASAVGLLRDDLHRFLTNASTRGWS